MLSDQKKSMNLWKQCSNIVKNEEMLESLLQAAESGGDRLLTEGDSSASFLVSHSLVWKYVSTYITQVILHSWLNQACSSLS